MRNRFQFIWPILDYLGALFWIFGFVLLAAFAAQIYFVRTLGETTSGLTFLLPSVIAFILGFGLKRRVSFSRIDGRGAMMLCVFGWVGISALGALPFTIGLNGVNYLDAYFEAVSGFTTTGITMLQELDYMPRSVLLWRSVIQWLGGLGILTFFLAVISTRGSTHVLFSAETHKIFSKRPAPNLFRTLRILWAIYAAMTVVSVIALELEGMTLFDALCHSMTAISTGGYSPYDASVAYYAQSGAYPHYAAIEYTLTAVMLLGGINFFIHYRVLTGDVRALWDNLEIRLWWGLLIGATVIVAGTRFLNVGWVEVGDTIRHALFQVVALATTTGFETKYIGKDLGAEVPYYFSALARQVFLVLMVVGGCVGSTAGGIKVLRIGVLLKMVGRQIRHVAYGRATLNPVVVDREIIEPEEIRRISALFFAWIGLLVVGSAVTALFAPELEPMESASGMFSALGNIGPCYIQLAEMSTLHPVIKITYIIGMLAGRLEILPVLLLFSRRAWK